MSAPRSAPPRPSTPAQPRPQVVARPAAGNPFTPAVRVEPKGKLFLFGGTGVGKTHLGLTCPGKVAIVDTEGGTAFFAGRVPDFDVIGTKSYKRIIDAVEWIERNPGVYGTLVIDPATVIYEVLQDAAVNVRTARVVAQGGDVADVDIEQREWGRIKRLYKALMTRLVNLPCHVVVIAREKDETVRQNGEMVKVGVKPDAEKGTAYFFDVVAHLTVDRAGKRTATILKDRTGTWATGATIADPTFEAIFGKVLATKATEQLVARHVPSDDEAARVDAEVMGAKLASEDKVAELIAVLREAGYDPDEVRTRKGIADWAALPDAKVDEMIAATRAKIAALAEPPAQRTADAAGAPRTEEDAAA